MTEIELIINQFILEAGKLYTLPELYQQLDEQINSDTTSSDEIAKLLSTDAALCARLLKIANCPIYGFRAEISTVTRALNMIGLKEVKNLILMDTVAQNFNKKDKYNVIQMKDFWRRSVYIALIAKKLAKKIKHPQPDRLFISGIMSRIGQLVCCLTRRKEVLLIVHHQENYPTENEFHTEANILGFCYNEISAKLLAHWKVPEEITIPLENLHQPLNIPPSFSATYHNDIDILHVACVYSYLLLHDEKQSQKANTLDDEEFEPGITTAEFYLNKIPTEINQNLKLNSSDIDDLLFEIEIDALEILGIVFQNV